MSYFKRVSSRAVAIALGMIAFSSTNLVEGAIIYSTAGSTYSQNFDTLITTGTTQPWTNDSTLPGWNLFRRTDASTLNPPVAITTYNATDGATTTGAFYSFGASANTERAFGGIASSGTYFGSPASGAIAGWIAASIQNTTGDVLESFTLGFDGEQWRNGGNTSAQTMALEYGYGATIDTVASWTAPGGNFNWASTVNTGTAAAVNGNVAGLVAGKGGTVTGQAWANGDTLWVRWVENNDVGNDHGLAIDNFSFSAVPVPEPSTVILGSLATVGLGFVSMRKRKA